MARSQKIYAVKDGTGSTTFVKAMTSTSALAFVVATLRKQFSVDQATTDQLIAIGREGTTLHDADAEPADE